jgi:PAS domain S-box-containing protein
LYISNLNDPFPDTDKAALIKAEQTKLLFHALPVALVASVINALILVFIQWGIIEPDILISWLTVFLLLSSARLLLAYAYNKTPTKDSKSENWANWFIVGAISSGFAWGSTAVWLFPAEHVGHQLFLVIVLAGTCAGASTSLSFLRMPIIVYLLAILTPLAIQFLLLGDKLSVAMGIMVILFFIMVLASSMRIYKNTEQNISLRIEAYFRERALQESEEKYHLIFDSAPLGVVHYDKNGVITEFNDRFVHILGLNKNKLDNLSLLYEVNDPNLKEAIQKSLQGEFSQYEGKSNALGGEQDKDVRIYCRGIKSDSDEFIGGVAIVEDITEDKKVERLKSEFVSTVSHELRTPLTAIRGAVGLLNEGVAGELSNEARKLTEISQANTNRLLMLIDDILDISKIELGELSFDFKTLDVRELLEEVVQTMEPYARQHQVKLVLNRNCFEVYIKADHDRMMQVMCNLLSNAVKFSPPRGTVEVSMECVTEGVRIAVKDSGPGIPPEFQEVIFDRFTQFDSSDSRRTGGTGLGLAITKALVEKHNGRIGFDTSEAGSTFYLVLPRELV